MKRILAIIIAIFLVFPLFAETFTADDVATIGFRSSASVDVEFSYAPMNNNILPPPITGNVELKLNNLQWVSDTFYLHLRVYTQETVELTLSVMGLQEYNIGLTGTSGYVDSTPLSWTNIATWTDSTRSPGENFRNVSSNHESSLRRVLLTEDGSTVTSMPRYYSWPFRMLVDNSSSVGNKYYRSEFYVKVEAVE